MGEKSGVVGKVVHYYWIIESAKKWIMECVNEQIFRKKPVNKGFAECEQPIVATIWQHQQILYLFI